MVLGHSWAGTLVRANFANRVENIVGELCPAARCSCRLSTGIAFNVSKLYYPFNIAARASQISAGHRAIRYRLAA